MKRSSMFLVATIVALTAGSAYPAQAQAAQAGARGLIISTRISALNAGNPQLVAVNPSDGEVRVLTTGHQDGLPDLSPDGHAIVFQRCLHAADCDQIGKINIWTMRTDGSHQHPLTACDGTTCLGAFDPAFSPDGRFIAFQEDLLDAHGVNFNGIFIMRTDGTHLRRLTSSGPDGLPDGQPHFSPDGKRVVFQREMPDGNRLMIVRTDGTGLRPLLTGVDGVAPSWAPDGNRVAFTLVGHASDTPTFDVATVRLDGSDLKVLTDSSAGIASFTPDYSPDGGRLVFSQSSTDGCPLVVARTSGNGARVLPVGAGCFVDASWGPDAGGER